MPAIALPTSCGCATKKPCLRYSKRSFPTSPCQFHELTPSYAGAVWMASAAFAGQWQRSVATEHSNGEQWTSVSTSWHHEWIVCMDNPFSCLGEPFFPFADPNKMYKCTGNLNRNTPMLSLYWNHIYHLPGSKYWSTLRRGYDHPSCNEPKHWAALLGHEFTRGPFWISRDKAWSINMAGSWSESTKRKCIQWQADWALLWKES